MLHAYTGSAVRAAEQPLLDQGQGPELMARAALGLANVVAATLRTRRGRVYGGRLLVLAGAGNNGGDALWAAAALCRRGAAATAVLTGERAHPEGLAAFSRAGGRILRLTGKFPATLGQCLQLARGADVVLDGILGTGGRGSLRGVTAELTAGINALRSRASRPAVVACDLPSGVDADTGQADETVLLADATVTFGGTKAGLWCGPGEGSAGEITLVRIGVEDALGAPTLSRLEAADLRALLPTPGRADQKYSRGVLGVVAGSQQYPGAAQLACAAALACGVGMIRYLGPSSVAALIHAQSPEAVAGTGSVGESRVQAWLAGPGTNDDDEQLRRVRDALEAGVPVVADAGALTVLPARLPASVILTPHAGELSTLFSRLGRDVPRAEIEAKGLPYAREAASLTGATVLLKGASTLVASPSGRVFSQAEGTPWLATAGSGDTLAGILGALAAAVGRDESVFRSLGIGAEDRWAAIGAAGASLHGRAGVLASGNGPLRALDIAASVSQAWRSVTS
ncbi:MAG: NAD(P)H-hydrate dehydratase [Micrococcaceae bacterium]|nr:NAD(P)H-hydrate dehydratase [Micrococcaceae bacterium]